MTTCWESLFRTEALHLKHSEDFIKECLDYSSVLRQNNLPVIFDLTHLSILLQTTEELLMADNNNSYDTFKFKKKSGGTREISAPHAYLKYRQEWIYHNILKPYNSGASVAAYGFVENKSILDNARCHLNKKWIINIDLENFFGTITREQVRSCFSTMGYVDCVVEALTSICTRYNVLPQGASTSPALSNIVCKELDSDLMNYASSKGYSYTRYADDMTFSGDSVDTIPPIREIYEIIERHDFHINRHKTQIRKQGQKMSVTGLTVNDGVHVHRSYKKEVWRELHFCKRFTPEEHKLHIKLMFGQDTGYYKEWLLGRIMFIKSVDKECGQKMLTRFNEINWMF